MKNTDREFIIKAAKQVLYTIPRKAFFCLPMSSHLYALINDHSNMQGRLVSGHLRFKNTYLFKQDFSVITKANQPFSFWAGHSWVEVEDLIVDVSFFRTVYSKEFTSPTKKIIESEFGLGRGLLIGTKKEMQDLGLYYERIDYLTDDIANGFIKITDELLNMY